MKKLLLLLTFLLCSCTQLLQGQSQPVKFVDPNKNIYSTTCSGAVEDWGSCAQKASQTCNNNYQVLKRFENPVGGFRELTFECIK
jgi:hypothetical protein